MVVSMRVMSAGRGYEYLLKSVAAGDSDRHLDTSLTEYYTRSGTPPGIWMGTGLPALGTDDTGRLTDGALVTEAHLARLLGQGLDPITGEKLGGAYRVFAPPDERIQKRLDALPAALGTTERAEAAEQIRAEEEAKGCRQPVAGFDFTFSPPKSFSVLWALADEDTRARAVQAHHAAVRDVLNFLEREVAATRVGRGGVLQVSTLGVVAAAFDHYDSRAGDPQLHTHLVVSNKVQGPDGKWRMLDSRALHKATVALSETYNAYLKDHAENLLGVSWEPFNRGKDRNPGWEIRGVPRELMDEFSQRTTGGNGGEGIEAVKDRLIAEYLAEHGRGPSPATIIKLRQQATLETRPAKQVKPLTDLVQDWRERAFGILGMDATEWSRALTTRQVTTQLPVAASSDQMVDIARTVLAVVSDKRATWQRWNLHAEAARQTMNLQCETTEGREAIITAVVELAENQSMRLTPVYDRVTPAGLMRGGVSGFQPRETIHYSSTAIFDAEDRLLSHGRDVTGPRLKPRAVSRFVNRPNRRGVTLSTDQAGAIRSIALSGRVLDVLVGPAGAGKTTALGALQRAWEARHGAGSVIGLAPSAVAADVLAGELGIPTENTAKFLYEHERERGRWNLTAGQMVLLDEASLAGTLTLDRIVAHASSVGAKVVLIGDWAQLTAVETGGAFRMLVRDRGAAPELSDVHRFRDDWEKTASLALRQGNREALGTYADRDRVHEGDGEAMLTAAYEAWRADTQAGLVSLMIAATGHDVTALNRLAQTGRAQTGQTQPGSTRLHDGNTAGVGDLIVTRENNRRLTTGKSWVKNGDRWQVTATHPDGELTVRRLTKTNIPYGRQVRLPAGYVAQSVELGYATTVHRAQGLTVDTAHALVDARTGNRELLYVAMTRGAAGNHIYVNTDVPEDLEAHHDNQERETGREILERVLKKTGADTSAHETLAQEADRHAPLELLIDEYEAIANLADSEHWATMLEASAFTQDQVDRILENDHYQGLQTSFRRLSADGHNLSELTNIVARGTAAIDDPTDALQKYLDRYAAAQRSTRSVAPERVAGLLPKPAGSIPVEFQEALIQRARLIDERAQKLAAEALQTREPWVAALGKPPATDAGQKLWARMMTTVALYRVRYEITDPTPLGQAANARDRAQADEFRAAQNALTIGRRLTPDPASDNDDDRLDRSPSIRSHGRVL